MTASRIQMTLTPLTLTTLRIQKLVALGTDSQTALTYASENYSHSHVAALLKGIQVTMGTPTVCRLRKKSVSVGLTSISMSREIGAGLVALTSVLRSHIQQKRNPGILLVFQIKTRCTLVPLSKSLS